MRHNPEILATWEFRDKQHDNIAYMQQQHNKQQKRTVASESFAFIYDGVKN